jgi:SAM-dependent methyltransferase
MSDSVNSGSPSSTSSAGKSFVDRYVGDEHLAHHPMWHLDESAWKAQNVLRMLERNRLTPKKVVDIGCGAGEVLRLLQQALGTDCEFWGFDVSPYALAMSERRQNERLHFKLGELPANDVSYDLTLALDVVEHVEDCFSFLRAIKPKSFHTIFEVPLDLSVQTVARAGNLPKKRQQHGHIHYFTKELALQLLEDTGFEVVDYFYTSPALELPSRSPRILILRPALKLVAAFSQDFGARFLGGYRLMILAR